MYIMTPDKLSVWIGWFQIWPAKYMWGIVKVKLIWGFKKNEACGEDLEHALLQVANVP